MDTIRNLGGVLPEIVRGEISVLDFLAKDEALLRFHRETFGMDSYVKEVARIAKLISNRYPHINILEIGAGAGEATQAILGDTDVAFTTYTCTDFLNAHVQKLQESIQGFNERVAFKVLDIEKDVTDQGYQEESFDLVIASMSLYATQCLESTLSNVRRLIKPGGYLIILEPTDPSVMRLGVMLGGLQAWWMGHAEGRDHTPFVSRERWGELFQATGFSAIDTCMPHSQELPVPFSVMVTQATDNRVNFLRNPMASEHIELGAKSLTIIGGQSSLATSFVLDVTEAVGRHYESIKVYTSFSDIVVEDLPVMGTVLSLTELDEAVFPSLNAEIFASFQGLFKQSKNVLWVVHGAQGTNPHGKMFLGAQRTLLLEMKHLRQQFLNFETKRDATGELIAKRLLAFEALDIWEQDNVSTPLLCSTEPEISFEDGRMMIPRIKLNERRNNRYNSNKRLIVKNSDREASNIVIQQSQNQYQVLEQAHTQSSLNDHIKIEVSTSFLRAMKVTEKDHLFLIAGQDSATGSYVVALSDRLASRVDVPLPWVIKCGTSQPDATGSMIHMYNHFLAQSLISQALPGAKVAALDVDFSLAEVLQEYASQRGVQLVLFTTTHRSCTSPWVFVHPRSTQREIVNNVPKGITRFLNCGGSDDMFELLSATLPAYCQIDTEETLTLQTSQSSTSISRVEKVALNFQYTWNRVHHSANAVNLHRVPTLGLSDLTDKSSLNHKQSLVSWEGERLPVQILPASKKVKFSPNKTYWLVGLTKELGLTLCEWMARQGARYIALSSRSPRVSEHWIRRMADNGCNVRVFANDITNRDSIKKTYREILETMPAVGGVAQGAMVLQDTTFLDLNIDRVENVLKPKVQGSILLDELFSEDTLDFMIFFSSMAAITGSPGQVSYSAANLFMTSLAAQRQKRGLAAQAINIGAIVGNGYVTRELNMDQQVKLYEVGHSWMSEQDFHEIFAEGVISCLEGKGTSEICSGIRIDDDDSKEWILNPVFQHLVLKSNTLLAADQKSKAGMMVKAQLLEATSQEEVMQTLKESFTLKLQSVLDTDPSKQILDMNPDELGVDSLVAVDLRSWFLKELAVDMPMLKIFGAASIIELLESALSMIPVHLTPNVKKAAPAEADPGQVPTVDSLAAAKAEARAVSEAQETKTFQLEYNDPLIDSVSSAASIGTDESDSVSNESTSVSTPAVECLEHVNGIDSQKAFPALSA